MRWSRTLLFKAKQVQLGWEDKEAKDHLTILIPDMLPITIENNTMKFDLLILTHF